MQGGRADSPKRERAQNSAPGLLELTPLVVLVLRPRWSNPRQGRFAAGCISYEECVSSPCAGVHRFSASILTIWQSVFPMREGTPWKDNAGLEIHTCLPRARGSYWFGGFFARAGVRDTQPSSDGKIYTPSSSSNAFASFRSRVSKPSVNQS